MAFAVLDVLGRYFVVHEGEWCFESHEYANAVQQAEYEEYGDPFLIVEFDDPPRSARWAKDRIPFPDGPLLE